MNVGNRPKYFASVSLVLAAVPPIRSQTEEFEVHGAARAR